MGSTIDDFGTITLTSSGVSQQGVLNKGPAIYKSALLRNIDGASAAWGAKLIWLLMAILTAALSAFTGIAGLTSSDDSAALLTSAVFVFVIAIVFYYRYQQSKMCVLNVFAGQLTMTDRINAPGIDTAIDFIDALERAQSAEQAPKSEPGEFL